MKIIGHDKWTRLIKCRVTDCGAEMDIDESDLRAMRFDADYIGSGTMDVGIECGLCGCRIRITQLPSHIRSRVLRG